MNTSRWGELLCTVFMDGRDKPGRDEKSLVFTAAPRANFLAGVALALLMCAGCASDRAATSAPPSPPDPKTEMAALEARIFDIVQNERHKINPAAKLLAMDSELMDVARRRSTDMAQKNYIAHKGPDGQTSASLIMDEDQDFQGLLGENLASQNFVRRSGVDVDSYARRFVDSWLASPQNRENLSFTNYDRSAVGAAVGGDTIYVTQLFATDLGLTSPVKDPKKRETSEWTDPQSAASAPPAKQSKPVLPSATGSSAP